DVLFEIDPRTYRAALAQAEANLGQAEAHVRRLGLDLDRYQRLRGTGAVSREDYDKAVGDKAEAEAAVGSAAATRDTARLNLDFTKVKAPVDGRVSRIIVTVGNLIQSGETGGGTLLTTLVSVDPMYAY